MDKKMPKKISLKDFGMEKIILIAIAGIVLLAANFSEWKNSSSKTSEKQEKSIETSQNDAYVEALENKLVHILENPDKTEVYPVFQWDILSADEAGISFVTRAVCLLQIRITFFQGRSV